LISTQVFHEEISRGVFLICVFAHSFETMFKFCSSSRVGKTEAFNCVVQKIMQFWKVMKAPGKAFIRLHLHWSQEESSVL